jgi:hypothetical protein
MCLSTAAKIMRPYHSCFKHNVLIGVAEPEPHHFDGAGAVTRCGSGPGSNGSKLNVLHKRIIKNDTTFNSFVLFLFIFVTILIIQNSEVKVAPTLRLP